MRRPQITYDTADSQTMTPPADTPPPPPEPERPERTERRADPDAYWQTEARKAFQERDKVKAEMRKLAEEKEAREAAEKENKLKAENQWEALRQNLVEKHEKAITERESTLKALEERFRQTLIKAEFGRATALFGENTKTILDVDMAIDVLGKYVTVQDDDRVVVTKPNGEVILGDDGRPASFTAAMDELIAALPNRDRILRGSGKSGSGSAGGDIHPSKPPDLVELTKRVQAGDKAAIAALKQRQAASGQMTIGRRLR